MRYINTLFKVFILAVLLFGSVVSPRVLASVVENAAVLRSDTLSDTLPPFEQLIRTAEFKDVTSFNLPPQQGYWLLFELNELSNKHDHIFIP
ncbi:hypothetical protein [Pseudoalteromonas sp. SaAl2]